MPIYVVKDVTHNMCMTFADRRKAYAFFDQLADAGYDAIYGMYSSSGVYSEIEHIKHPK